MDIDGIVTHHGRSTSLTVDPKRFIIEDEIVDTEENCRLWASRRSRGTCQILAEVWIENEGVVGHA